ncbi:hypothetical protein WME94_21775 [Sorangium sp. So ce429]
MGALPTLRAAGDPGARGGEYYGPGGLLGLKGTPERGTSSARSHDVDAQRHTRTVVPVIRLQLVSFTRHVLALGDSLRGNLA